MATERKASEENPSPFPRTDQFCKYLGITTKIAALTFAGIMAVNEFLIPAQTIEARVLNEERISKSLIHTATQDSIYLINTNTTEAQIDSTYSPKF